MVLVENNEGLVDWGDESSPFWGMTSHLDEDAASHPNSQGCGGRRRELRWLMFQTGNTMQKL